MKFLIAGCGIGGLTAAHSLVLAGHQVQLLERAAKLEPVGAGISLQPNSMQALEQLGLAEAIEKVAWAADQAQVLSSKGQVLKRFDFSNYRKRFGFLPLTIFRGDLIDVLAENLDEHKVEVALSESAQSFEQGEMVRLVSSNGNSFDGDALVGADGIHSHVRRRLWGTQQPQYAGYTCWRGMVEDPNLVDKIDTMTEVWGKGARFGMMRCNPKQVYWFATEDRKQRTDQSTDTNWTSRFQNWVHPIPDLLEATPDTSIVHNDIVDLMPIESWGMGRVTLLGDAAHAMTPNFGQGGAQAIEDAVILGKCVQDSEDIETAFRQYESFRIPRTTELVKGARQYGRIAQGGNWLQRIVRDQVMTRLPKRFVDKQLEKQLDFRKHLADCGHPSGWR